MILPWLIVWLLVGSLLAWLVGRRSPTATRWLALLFLVAHLAVVIVIWIQGFQQGGLNRGGWLFEFDRPWIPSLGASLYLAMDGLSLLLVALVDLLGIMAIGASWTGIQERVGFFHFNLLWSLGALVGAFLALDLFLFYLFWEMTLIPLYFLIGIWGHERRVYATLKFFLFTQAGSLLMLLSILGLYFAHGQSTGVYTFNYNQLLGTAVSPVLAFWLMMGFLIAFGVKLPVVPLHTWLPDAHTEAPTAGSVILAGLLLKAGAYGMLRFLIPLLPQAAFSIDIIIMALGAAGILYGAIMAFAQSDLKRLVAYTSVSHMGFVLLGIFSWNQLALQGAVIVILAHGISTGALFILVGSLQDRLHTRSLDQMGGFWSVLPRMGGAWMLFALAALGLPGLGNFVGEFLVLLGAFRRDVPIAVVATLGFILATVYALWMIQRIFAGPPREDLRIAPFTKREMAIIAALAVAIVWLGVYPQPVLNTAGRALEKLQQYSGGIGQRMSPPGATVTWPGADDAGQCPGGGQQ